MLQNSFFSPPGYTVRYFRFWHETCVEATSLSGDFQTYKQVLTLSSQIIPERLNGWIELFLPVIRLQNKCTNKACRWTYWQSSELFCVTVTTISNAFAEWKYELSTGTTFSQLISSRSAARITRTETGGIATKAYHKYFNTNCQLYKEFDDCVSSSSMVDGFS